MKKIIMALAAALLAVTAVSAKPKMFADAGITIPVLANLDPDSGVKSEKQTSFGIDFSFRAMFTDLFGVYAQSGTYFPLENVSDTDDLGELKTKQSDVDSWYGFNMLIAPAIMPVHTEKFGLTIAPGLMLSTLYLEKDIEVSPGVKQVKKATSFMIGAGCNVGFDIHLAKNMYIKPSVEMGVYFHEWTKKKQGSKDDTDDKSIAQFSFKPGVAFGFQF